jgi:membrane-bound serine protease (ClpP class)
MTLSHINPDAAIVLFTLGTLLIYLELNRPGSILPGALGLLLTLLAIAAILPQHLAPFGLILLAAASLLFLINLRHALHQTVAILSTICLIFGFQYLLQNPTQPRLHTATSMACGLLLGVSSTLLTNIARRARANKRLDLERARTSRPGVSQS